MAETQEPISKLEWAAVTIAAGMCAQAGEDNWDQRWGGIPKCAVKWAREIIDECALSMLPAKDDPIGC